MMHDVVHPWMYQQQPWPPMMMAPYQAPPPPAWNQQPPMMNPYQAPPPAWNQQPPMMGFYQAPPPPAWNQQPPMMAFYQAPPPAWNQQPPMMALYQAPPPQLVLPQQYFASLKPQSTAEEEEEEEARTLWIGDLQYWMDEAFINLYCFPGEVFTTKVIRNKKTGKSKGYGFIVFQSHAIARRILHIFNGTPMPGMMVATKMRLNWASSSSSSFGSGGEKQQQQRQEVDAAAAAADDIVTTTDDYMFQQKEETLITTSVKVAKVVTLGHGRGYAMPMGGGGGQYGMGQFHYILDDAPLYPELEEGFDSRWEDMLEYWRNKDQMQRPKPSTEVIVTQNVFGTAQVFKEMAKKKESQTVDVFQRVSEIAAFFEIDHMTLNKLGVTPRNFEDLLDELQGYVGSIDVANALHSIGGLVPLIENLYNMHVGVRAKVAEVITTMVQYSPRSQQLVMESNNAGFVLFSNFIADTDETARTNALGALSALIWNNIPGVTGFELKSIYERLMVRLVRWSLLSVGFQRKALNLVHHLLHENNSDCNLVTESGLPRIMMHMASSVDADVREAALRCLLLLARVEGGNSGQLVKNDDKLKQVLQELIGGFSAMVTEDLGPTREERQLVDSLWNACYNEPSPLREGSTCVAC